MNTVLITGGARFVGSHLCDYFLMKQFKVIGIDNYLTGTSDNITTIRSNPNFTFIRHDINEPIEIKDKLDLIMHFACPASPVDYCKYPIETMRVDSVGTYNTLEMAKKHRAIYLFASTSEIYGDPLIHPQEETQWGNVNTLGRRSVYDEAKRFSESMTACYHREYNLDARIVRIFNTYGPRMRLNDGRVVPNFITQAIRNENITIYGEGKQTRSFCFIDDLIKGIYQFATMKGLNGKVINLGNPDEYTILEFAHKILAKFPQSKSKLVFCDLPEDDPKQRKPVIERAKQYLDWTPEINLDRGIEITIEYFNNKIKSIK